MDKDFRDDIPYQPVIEAFEALIEEQNRARQEETFVQAVVRNMFPRPLKPYGNALWLIGRQSNMYATGVLK
jgi:hypothetical protein